VVLLPKKQVSFVIGDPLDRSYFYHFGAGNHLDNNMTGSITLPAGTVTLSMQARYQIETCWDYAMWKFPPIAVQHSPECRLQLQRLTMKMDRTLAMASPAHPGRPNFVTFWARRYGCL
jgi:hypothetical protein